MKSDRRFLVLSRQQVMEYILDIPHVCISVRDPGSVKAKLPENTSRLDSLYLEFDDLDFEPDRVLFDEKTPRRAVMFKETEARKILEFYNKWDVRIFIINCEAGISRSAAIAAALSKISGYDDSLFFKKYHPNRLVYRKILEAKYGGRKDLTNFENVVYL